jgi:C4-dicarboxylate-specific signal transduction histidine kinase
VADVVRWVREKAEVEFDDANRPVRGIGTVQDITARKTAEAEIDRLSGELAHVTRVATLGEFAAALAHELNQPLTAILANAQAALRFLDRGEPDLTEIREILADIAGDDQRARDIILKLRELTRKPLGRRPPEPLRVNPLVTDVLRIVRADLTLRGVELATAFAEDLPAVSANGVQIQQALLNLILNALEAMDGRETRRLSIETRPADGSVEIAVADTGPGFGEGGPEAIFRPFFTTKDEGMGMGLAISRAAVEAHGGTITAGDAEGGGAEFVVALPARGEAA